MHRHRRSPKCLVPRTEYHKKLQLLNVEVPLCYQGFHTSHSPEKNSSCILFKAIIMVAINNSLWFMHCVERKERNLSVWPELLTSYWKWPKIQYECKRAKKSSRSALFSFGLRICQQTLQFWNKDLLAAASECLGPHNGALKEKQSLWPFPHHGTHFTCIPQTIRALLWLASDCSC